VLTAVLKKDYPNIQTPPLVPAVASDGLIICKPRTPAPTFNKFRHTVLSDMNSFPIQDMLWIINGTFADLSFMNNLQNKTAQAKLLQRVPEKCWLVRNHDQKAL
jgi:hypothetical protein